MLYRTLGRSGIPVSLASYGTGGPSQFGKSAGLTAGERRDIIARALDLGVNLFDTAAGYGGGDSERWLGEALQGASRDSYLIATKWSWRKDVDSENRGAEALEASIERSMARLHTDVIDIMMLHGLTPGIYSQAVERYAPALVRLKDQGKIRLIGFSEMMTEDPKHTVPESALEHHSELWDVIMLKYGILNQWAAKKALPMAQRRGVAILNMAPVRYTLTRPDELASLLQSWEREGVIDVQHPKIRDGLDWLVGDGVSSIISAGYKFAAHHPAVSTVIIGTSSIQHLEENVASLEDPVLPEQHIAELKHLLGDSASPR